MITTLLLIALATALVTFFGGLFAFRFKDKLHLVLGFSAGAVIGVAFFDLLPEALATGISHGSTTITACVAVGFVVYLIVDRFLGGADLERGSLRASSFSIHSLLDGIGIGLAFQASTVLGFVVALAVLAHDFSDGINTVSAIVKGGGSRKRAMHWLALDAIAPVIGIISTLFFSISESTLGLVLAIFAGFFLYIGASDLVPESYHSHPTRWTTVATVLGVAFIYIVVHFAG